MKKIIMLEDQAGVIKDTEVDVDDFTASEMVRLKHAKYADDKKEHKEPAKRQTKEAK
jgi:hypothetical protein